MANAKCLWNSIFSKKPIFVEYIIYKRLTFKTLVSTDIIITCIYGVQCIISVYSLLSNDQIQVISISDT